MFLYRLEAKGKGFPDSQVIVFAEDEEKAFAAGEALLEKNALGLITIDEFAIMEKKRPEKGSGYVVEAN
ncbi:uncharacterized protein DUF3906 [Tumebacillus sp. BK434]|uniref:DUF3906 family protein n=1 Tax=Tumebacillus sp. BK434 TaxID=2512169 RepID=UPI00104851F4|nr:DUF3906 family protein [Tumebacillus sp. BK434]TCP55447.1 uncharacterized protein DUF3906 [Tumebacillus sp. BK434]